MRRPSYFVLAVILAVVTVFVWSTGAWTFENNQLPFDMEQAYHSNPTAAGWLTIACATALTINCVCLCMYIYDQKWRSTAYRASFFAWMIGLLLFVYGTGSQGIEWVYMLVVTIPPFLSWFATSPSIEIAGEQW